MIFYSLKSLGPKVGPSEYWTNTLNHYKSVSAVATTAQETTVTKHVGIVVTLYICIREVLSSNLGRWMSSVPPGKCRDSLLRHDSVRPRRSQFTSHPTIRR
jgi:hypothetical protein